MIKYFKDGSCVPCSPGTYKSTRKNMGKCESCPRGYYQPRRGAIGCLRCPAEFSNGQTNFGMRGAKHIKYCSARRS